MKMTSAYANKVLRQLNEEKDYYLIKERESMFYTAAVDEEPYVPEYDYAEVADIINKIDEKICKIKHAINLSNSSSEVEVFGKRYTIDVLLVRMAQLNKRKSVLDKMRTAQPQSRVDDYRFASSRNVPEYQYINFDPEVVARDFDEVSKILFEMQMKLDQHNQTTEFDVDID